MTLLQILTLLQLAINLLVSAQSPNVPQTLRDKAISTANYAIIVANESLKNNNSGFASTPIIATSSPAIYLATSSPAISLSAFDFKLSHKIVGTKVIFTADGFRDQESIRGGFKWWTVNLSNQIIVSKELDKVFYPQNDDIVNQSIQFTAKVPLDELSPYDTLGYTTHYFRFLFTRASNNSISQSDSLEFAKGF